MSPQMLAQALGIPYLRADQWAPHLTEAMVEFGIASPRRQAAFLAQIGHESDRLTATRERWGPTDTQRRYGARADLGNTSPAALAAAAALKVDPGWYWRGVGLIQITGFDNIRAASQALFDDDRALRRPQLLEVPAAAARSAAWWWREHGCSTIADEGTDDAFGRLTQRINGGLNGLAERRALWATCRRALGA